VHKEIKISKVSPSPNILKKNDNKNDANGYRSTHATTEIFVGSRCRKR